MRSMLLLAFVLLTVILSGQDKPDYSAKFSGYVRAWHQTDFASGQGQFLVKQARMAIAGAVNEYASYKFQVDFTRLGKLTTSTTTIDDKTVVTSASANFSDILLDAQAIVTPLPNFDISAGQYKVPFSTDNLRADQTHDFANRPLLTNVAPGIRDIGLMLSYKLKGSVPAEFHVGTFNGSGFNKSENDKATDYALRAVVTPISNLGLSGNYYKGKSAGKDLHYFNFGMDYILGSLFLDAEYTNKQTKAAAGDIKGSSLFAYATYKINAETGFIKTVVPAVRYETFNPNTSDDNTKIDMVTLGLTFHFAKLTFAHFRINYELFDYNDGRENPNRLILELQTRF